MATAMQIGIDLDHLATKWAGALRDSVTGPLAIAAEVVAVAKRWDEHYRASAGGASCSSFLTSKLGAGRNLAYFTRRAEAVASLGEHTRRTWDHEAAVWATQATRDDLARARMVRAVEAYRVGGNHGVPLSLHQVQAVAETILGEGKPKATRKCARCARCDRMAAALLAAGLAVPE